MPEAQSRAKLKEMKYKPPRLHEISKQKLSVVTGFTFFIWGIECESKGT